MAEGAASRARAPGKFAISRLTFTIAIANFVGLLILLLGSFAVTGYRESLIAAKLEGVRGQAQIVADILAQVAIDAEACEPQEQPVVAGKDVAIAEPVLVCARELAAQDVNAVFNRIWDSFEGRVRIYRTPEDPSTEISDAAALLLNDVVLRQDRIQLEDLAPIEEPSAQRAQWQFLRSVQGIFERFMTGPFRRAASARTLEEELTNAIASPVQGETLGWSWVRENENGELVASVSIPIRRVHAVYGVVTSEIGGIDELVGKSRAAILPFFGLAIAAAVLSSLLLTAAIALPIRQLAVAADKVREGISAAGRVRIPDFTYRNDEIGELSGSLKAMTQAIYQRIDAIESFAADVAHELKNPLTSIRSATETLEIAKAPEAKEKLMSVIKHDVVRMDRLITDISNASRLDAELAREGRDALDLRILLADIVDLYRATQKEGEANVVFDDNGLPMMMFGNQGALGQVFRNIIDNAKSFSPGEGVVRIAMYPGVDRAPTVRVTIDDSGPGIPDDTLDKIFDRFYTKRKERRLGRTRGSGLRFADRLSNPMAAPSGPKTESILQATSKVRGSRSSYR